MKKYAVIGHPIGHSMSPFIHGRLFSLSGIDYQYNALDIDPSLLDSEISSLKELSGFNVTIPHKETIIKYLDDIDESAKRYGAVNCVSNKNGKLYGCSTDAYGFSAALKYGGVLLEGKVLVLGCGGAARTIAREAADNGCAVTVAALKSSARKANSLVNWITDAGGKAASVDIAEIKGDFDLLVNATPVGMYPKTDAMAITKEQLSNCKAVFDAVYNPAKTLLIKTAEALGIKTVGGMPMLVWQAVKAHEFWYDGSFNKQDIKELVTDADKKMTEIFSK